MQETRHYPSLDALQSIAAGHHQLSIPGRHEAVALTDACPRCLDFTRPAAVLDLTEFGRITSRIGAYRCRCCDAGWLCCWGPPRNLARNVSTGTQPKG